MYSHYWENLPVFQDYQKMKTTKRRKTISAELLHDQDIYVCVHIPLSLSLTYTYTHVQINKVSNNHVLSTDLIHIS